MSRSADGDQTTRTWAQNFASGQLEKPLSDFLVRDAFARTELGFGLGDRTRFRFVVDLLKTDLLQHVVLRPELPKHTISWT